LRSGEPKASQTDGTATDDSSGSGESNSDFDPPGDGDDGAATDDSDGGTSEGENVCSLLRAVLLAVRALTFACDGWTVAQSTKRPRISAAIPATAAAAAAAAATNPPTVRKRVRDTHSLSIGCGRDARFGAIALRCDLAHSSPERRTMMIAVRLRDHLTPHPIRPIPIRNAPYPSRHHPSPPLPSASTLSRATAGRSASAAASPRPCLHGLRPNSDVGLRCGCGCARAGWSPVRRFIGVHACSHL
jgi:hypothetical protein